MKKLTVLFAAIAMLAFTAPISAQDVSVDEIIDSYVENTGGADKWKALNSMRMIGKSMNQGMEFPVTVTSMRPNLQKVEVQVQDKQIIEAFDGENAWTINPFMGSMDATLKTEEESKEAAKQMFESEFIDYKEKGHTVSLEGTEEVDGTETYKVKLVKESGDEEYYFFDTEYFVPIMMRAFVKTGPMEGQAVDVYMSDYNEVEGMMIPHSIEQKINGQTFMQMTADKVELNVDGVDKEFFAFPDEK